MYTQLTQFGDSSSGLGSLGIDGKAFLIQLITFVIAYYVLRRYAFGPIIKIMRERQETIESGVKLGEKMKQEEIAMEAKVEKALQASRKKADEIIREAEDQAKEAIRAAEDQAKARAEGILNAAEDRIKQDTAQARRELEKELVSLIADTTEAVIKEKVDQKKDAQLIERALKQVEA